MGEDSETLPAEDGRSSLGGVRPAATRARWLTGVVVVLVTAATAVAWVAASAARTPAQRAAAAQPPPPSVVTAPVTEGQLVDEIIFDGAVARGENTPVPPPVAVPDVARLVVTNVWVEPGDTVWPGAAVAEVSGRPVIVLPGAFPAYRDLTQGDHGPDVKQFQEALQPLWGTPVTGVFDARTEADVTSLYAAAGYEPLHREAPPMADPAGSGATPAPSAEPATGAGSAVGATLPQVVVPVGEIAFVETLPAVVSATLVAQGAVADGPLLELGTGDWLVRADVDAGVAARLDALPDDPAIVLRGGPLDGRKAAVVAVREQRPTEEGAPSRWVAEFALPTDGDEGPALGDRQQVAVEFASSPADALIVPLSALWTAADGSVRVTTVNGLSRREVPVAVTLTMAGQAAVQPVGGAQLAAGDEVLVAYRDGAGG